MPLSGVEGALYVIIQLDMSFQRPYEGMYLCIVALLYSGAMLDHQQDKAHVLPTNFTLR